MFADLRSALRPALALLVAFTLLLGLAYPLVVLGIAQLALPGQANGSLVSDGGRLIGSSLIGQEFSGERYFHSRPSAAGKGFDASASSASNLAPGSADLAKRIGESVAALRAEGVRGPIPVDLVTSSGSGLDPDLSPAAAQLQVRRVAVARRLDPATVKALVEAQVEQPLLPVLGEPHVNLLVLNRQLDRLSATQGR
jgi:K+-transporting ATPase ATPase C chain